MLQSAEFTHHLEGFLDAYGLTQASHQLQHSSNVLKQSLTEIRMWVQAMLHCARLLRNEPTMLTCLCRWFLVAGHWAKLLGMHQQMHALSRSMGIRQHSQPVK